jgi:alkylation response protein AidB-like acyl-CoA dehydrogenase
LPQCNFDARHGHVVAEKQCLVADRGMQLFGGYGYLAEYPIARI